MSPETNLPEPNPAGVLFLVAVMVSSLLMWLGWWLGWAITPASAFGPISKPDQCISVNALINRNCAPVYMCNGPKGTNADWCCSTEQRWVTEEQKLLRWYKRNCENAR